MFSLISSVFTRTEMVKLSCSIATMLDYDYNLAI